MSGTLEPNDSAQSKAAPETGWADTGASGVSRLPGTRSVESVCRRSALFLAALFFLLYVPTLPSLSRWRGDERFYTDAVIGMERSGNYLTPTYPDGSLRFKKPILTYWLVLSGYKIFGHNYFASRLPFLVCGALSVWLTFELGLLLIRRPGEALVASGIFASNLTVLHTSIRSTPDMAVCLFLLLSLLGFAGLLFHERRGRYYALAYFGAALAGATKGLQGLLPLIHVGLYVAIVRPAGRRARDLLHPVITPAAVMIAGLWYLWSFLQHGQDAAADFLGDQVGERLSGEKWYILNNAVVYLGSFVIQLLPWSLLGLIAFAARRRKILSDLRQNRPTLLFAGLWVVLLFVVFISGNMQRTRYFMPAYPFLALFYAMLLLHGSNDSKTGNAVDVGLRVFYRIAVIVGIAWAGFGLLLGPTIVLSGAILAILAFAVGRCSATCLPAQRLAVAAGYIVGAFAVNLLFIVPAFNSSPAPGMTAQVVAARPGPGRVPLAGVSRDYASQIRVLSAGKLEPYLVSDGEWDHALAADGLVICTEKVLQTWAPKGVSVERCATGSLPWKARDYLALFRSKTRETVRKSKLMEYFLVTRSRGGGENAGKETLNMNGPYRLPGDAG